MLSAADEEPQPAAHPTPHDVASGADTTSRTRPGLGPFGPGVIIAGQYRLVRILGRGGLSVVWLARQEAPVERWVALKLLAPGLETPTTAARFEGERNALSRMGHPFVARIYDAGYTDHGQAFVAMEHIDGPPIDEYCRRRRLDRDARLRLFVRVCRGVAHAHQKGVIHRDLKPSNILVVDDDGEATPKVIDFGIAKSTTGSLTSAPNATRMGFVVGTPGYMSPEQASGTGKDVDTTTDVYALGVILYELLTGALPFPAPSAEEAILNVLSLPTPRVADQRPETLPPVPPEIDLLLGKALQKKPASRPTMAEFHRLTVALLARLAREDGRPPGGTPASLIAVAPDPHHEAPTLSGPSEHLEALLDRLVATPSSPDGGLRRRVTDELTPLGDPGPRLTADGAGPRLTADRAGPRLTADEPALARATPEPPLEPAADPAPALLPATLHLAALPPQAAPAAAATAGPPRRPVVLVTLGVALGIALLALAISLIRPRPSGGAFADALAPTTAPPPAAPAAPPRPAHPVLTDGGPAPAARSPAHDAGKGKRNGAHPPRGFKGRED